MYQNTTFIRFQKLLFWQNNRIYDSFSIGTLAGACHTQAPSTAPRPSTRQNNSLQLRQKVNSKPSGSGRSPLNRFANRPVKPQSAFFEFCSFVITEFFSFRIVSGGVFFTSFFLFSHITNCFFCHTGVLVLLFNKWYFVNSNFFSKNIFIRHVIKIFNCRKTCNSW